MKHKYILFKFFAYVLKCIGIIIGFPGLVLTAIGLGLSDLCEQILDYCELED